MPELPDYDDISGLYPDFADWADAETVVSKDGKTFNMTPAQFAQVSQAGMAAAVHTHVIADVTGLQDALDNVTIGGIPGLQDALDGKVANGAVASTDAGNAISNGADGLAYLSSGLLGGGGDVDLSDYATIAYVDAEIATLGAASATNARVDDLEADITVELAALTAVLEGIG